MKRERYLDTVKLFAIFCIFLVHFVAHFKPEYSDAWREIPSLFFLELLWGKWGVSLLGVILGYFAFGSGEPNTAKYVIKRYFFFVLCGFFINSIYGVLGWTGVLGAPVSFRDIVVVSLKIGDGIFSAYWCMFPFFCGSVFAYISGRAKVGYIGLICEMIIFYMMGQVWISICLLGCLFRLLKNESVVKKLFSFLPVRLLAFAAVYLLLRHDETDFWYFADAALGVLMLLVIEFSGPVRKLFEWKPAASLGKIVTAVFLIHIPVYTILGGYLMKAVPISIYAVKFWVVFVICFAASLALAYPVNALLQWINRCFGKGVNLVFSEIEKKVARQRLG